MLRRPAQDPTQSREQKTLYLHKIPCLRPVGSSHGCSQLPTALRVHANDLFLQQNFGRLAYSPAESLDFKRIIQTLNRRLRLAVVDRLEQRLGGLEGKKNLVHIKDNKGKRSKSPGKWWRFVVFGCGKICTLLPSAAPLLPTPSQIPCYPRINQTTTSTGPRRWYHHLLSTEHTTPAVLHSSK